MTTPARSSPGCCSTATADGVRLVATDSYRLAVRDLAGVGMLSEGQKVLVGRAGPQRGPAGVLVGQDRRDVRSSARCASRPRRGRSPTRLIDGEFPNYEQLIPSGYPNRLTVSRETLEEAVRLMQIVGEGREGTPVRLAMSADGLELSSTAQERGRRDRDRSTRSSRAPTSPSRSTRSSCSTACWRSRATRSCSRPWIR